MTHLWEWLLGFEVCSCFLHVMEPNARHEALPMWHVNENGTDVLRVQGMQVVGRVHGSMTKTASSHLQYRVTQVVVCSCC